MANKQIPAAPLPDYYRAEDHGATWHLFCKVCGKGWSLDKSSSHPGNLLKLLDHARSHKKIRKE